MDDTNVWYDAYTAYLKHQLSRRDGENWRPDLVLEAVDRLWYPEQTPDWDRLKAGLRWAISEHGHQDEFTIALALADKLAEEYAEEQKRLAHCFEGWEEPEGYFDHTTAREHEEWARTRRLLHGDEDSAYFYERFRWVNGG